MARRPGTGLRVIRTHADFYDELLPPPDSPRGRGRPRTDWWWLFRMRVMPALERGTPLDEALSHRAHDLPPLWQRVGLQSLDEARRWVKEQRQASRDRLAEIGQRPLTGTVPDWEREFHEAVLLLCPPRRPGRPRKSGR